MKKFVAIITLVAFTFAMSGCADSKVIDGKRVESHGLFTQDEAVECVEYHMVAGNVVWSVLLIETIVFPVYFLGFSLWEPVGKDPSCKEE